LTNGVSYEFKVQAKNVVGGNTSQFSNTVTPATVPSAPTTVTATPGIGQAVVNFTPSANNGGMPITAYTVTASPGGASATGPGGGIVVTGLQNGGTYTFTVVATNALGNSLTSAPSSPVTLPNVPGLPTAVAATLSGRAEISVAFAPPAATGGTPITGYTVTSSPGGITATGATSPSRVDGLFPEATYTFTVHATNAVGSGAESTPSSSAVAAIEPAAPLSPAAVAGNSQAHVYWIASPDTGGSPVTSYTITTNPGGNQVTLAPPTPDSTRQSSAVVTGLTYGTAYTFSVVATNLVGSSQVATTNSVTPQAAVTGPANDNFANAQVISGAAGSVNGTNVGASREVGEPNHASNPGGASIWYVWTAPAGYNHVTFTTCGSGFNTLLAEYQGTTLANLLPLNSANANYTCPGNPLQTVAMIAHDLNPNGGDTYYIAIDGYNNGSGPATGTTVLNWTADNL
jgi:titin